MENKNISYILVGVLLAIIGHLRFVGGCPVKSRTADPVTTENTNFHGNAPYSLSESLFSSLH